MEKGVPVIEIVAWLVFVVLFLVAALHFLWATGSTWPVKTPSDFAPTFIGVDADKGVPGKGLTVVVATLILAAAILPLWSTDIIALPLPLPLPHWCKPSSTWVLFSVFLLRGISTYGLPNLPRAEPFRTLDRLYFAPLCLILAACYLSIALSL